MAAIAAARLGGAVTLLERNPKVGRKLYITGKGRCNVTNQCGLEELLANVPRNGKFLYSAFSRFLPEDAMAFFEELGVPLTVVEADVLAQAEICENQLDRCYRCKRFIFQKVREAAATDGFTVIVDGTNASDDPARRPGFKALAEAGIVSPLRRAGMTKANVRAVLAHLERSLGWEAGALISAKPSFPCLAVYVSEGEPITRTALDTVAQMRGL